MLVEQSSFRKDTNSSTTKCENYGGLTATFASWTTLSLVMRSGSGFWFPLVLMRVKVWNILRAWCCPFSKSKTPMSNSNSKSRQSDFKSFRSVTTPRSMSGTQKSKLSEARSRGSVRLDRQSSTLRLTKIRQTSAADMHSLPAFDEDSKNSDKSSVSLEFDTSESVAL